MEAVCKLHGEILLTKVQRSLRQFGAFSCPCRWEVGVDVSNAVRPPES